jgi:hypothetical protein
LDSARQLGALSRTLAASRIWPVAVMRRKRFVVTGALAAGLAAVAVISSTMLQHALSETSTSSSPSSAVDSQPPKVGAVSLPEPQPAAAGAPGPTGAGGMNAAEAVPDTTLRPTLSPKRKRGPNPKKPAPESDPRRPDPSIYDQYP